MTARDPNAIRAALAPHDDYRLHVLAAALDDRDAEIARLMADLEGIATETLDMPFVYRVRAKQALNAAAARRAMKEADDGNR